LALATFIAAAGFMLMALPLGFAGLCSGLILAGVGSSVQHPRASLLVTHSFGKAARGPLSIYNFSGDLGKASFPAIVALLLPFVAWRPVVGLMAVLGIVIAFALLALVPRQRTVSAVQADKVSAGDGGGGFNLLLAIGAFDTATRMGYLLFLPFLVHAKSGSEARVGVALALLFAGGALGKACCGWLGQHLGVVWSVITTEAATAVFMIATLMLPLAPMLALRHRRRRVGTDRIWRDRGSFQQNDRRRCGFPHGGCHRPHGSCIAPLPDEGWGNIAGPVMRGAGMARGGNQPRLETACQTSRRAIGVPARRRAAFGKAQGGRARR
jgi:MFS family permease